MRRVIFAFAFSLIALSCAKEQLEPPVYEQEQTAYNAYLLASTGATKASVSDDYVKISWTETDSLSVYTSKGRFVDFVYDSPEADGVVRFKGTLAAGETIDRYVVFPAGDHTVSDGQLYVHYPESYEYSEMDVRPVMLAMYESSDKVLEFSHLGGVFAFNVLGMPVGASSFEFSTTKDVTGLFLVDNNKVSVPDDEIHSSVIFHFNELEQVEDMKFFVPVPTGVYNGFTVNISGDDEVLMTKTATKENKIERTGLKKFELTASDIVYVTVNGAGNKTGESWENSKTFTAALADAKDGQVIRMASGVYVPDTRLEGSADTADERRTFLVKKNVTIQGSYKEGTSDIDTLNTPTVISGQVGNNKMAYHAMVVASPSKGQVVLRGLTFSKGSPMLVNTAALVETAPTTTTNDGIGVMDYRGGGLYVASDVVLNSCTIIDNTMAIHTNTSGSMGVGMYVASGADAVVEKSTFSNNVGGSCGGAIYTHGNLELHDCLLENNKSTHSGAVHVVGRATVNDCVFKANNATGGFAGALRLQGSQTNISNTSFVSNHATNHGGAIHNNRASMTFTNCHFESNASDADGGALANWGGGKTTLNTCTFVANTAVNGGAITNMVNAATDSQSELTVNKCVFKGNLQSDENDAEKGGAIINNGSKATISGSSFEGFQAASTGGAVINSLSKTLIGEIRIDKGCSFISNKAENGGAFANIDATAEVHNSDFVENEASGYAGAVYNAFETLPAVMTIKGTSFERNTSMGNGGAIMNWYADVSSSKAAPKITIQNSSFIENKVVSKNTYASQGGAIANQCGIVSIAGSEFKENFAAHAGAIYSYDFSLNTETALSNKVAYTYVYNSVFDGNAVDLDANSSAQGGDIRSHGKSKNVIVNSTFTNGTAPTGAVRLRTGATCYIVSSTFTDNVSGPYNQSSVMKVYNTISYGNTNSKYNYYANQKDGTDYIQSSFIGSMSISGGRATTSNTLYNASGVASDYTSSPSIFGTYKDGVYPVEAEPVLSSGMTTAELTSLANTIKAEMPDLEEKYFLRDQKESPRTENEKVMGAYIGDVYLDPNRYGYLNNTELIEENNLRGLITDENGNPIPGVAVSDGYDVVTSDANGVYQFAAHQDARLLHISVPAEYEIPYENNKPAFWVYIDPTDYEIRTDFKLTKRTSSSDEFTIFSLADTHVKTAEHYERFSTETMPDLAAQISAGNYSKNSFAVILGDIMFDNYGQVENVKTSLAASPVPVFPCFGNHDCSSSVGSSEVDLISKFQQHFGPVDYSFNIGKAHVVFMKNMIYEGKDAYEPEGNKYVQGILDHQLEWLKKDLAAVQDKENKLIIMCVHIPLRGTSNNSKNYSAVVKEMLKFKEAHVLSGHHHGVYNHIPSKDVTVGGKTFYDHNQIAAAGAWWVSNLNPDGSPNGYMIYDISGNTLKNHTLKGTNHDVGYQMRVYDGGESFSAPLDDTEWYKSHWTDYYLKGKYRWSASWSANLSAELAGKFVVHVFNADVRDWKVYFVDKNGKRTEMTRTTDNWYDVASYAYAGFYTSWSSGGEERYSTKVENTNFWYIDAPSGNPSTETGWRVEAEHIYNDRKVVYTANRIHKKYTGFTNKVFTDTVSLEDMNEVEYDFSF